MSLDIYYTPRAKQPLVTIYSFINTRFGISEADKFVAKAEKTINLISDHPYMFRSSGISDNVRVAFITKQPSMFYYVAENKIDILFFWDNRQEPLYQS